MSIGFSTSVAWFALFGGCEPPPGSPGHGAPVLVDQVTDRTATTGWISAALVAFGQIDATLDGVPLQLGWQPTLGDGYRVWRVPRGLAPGPHTVVFRSDRGDQQTEQVELTEPWFEEVSAAVGLDVPRHVAGWDLGCAESLTSVGFADVDLDGDPDVLIGDLLAPSRLFLAGADAGPGAGGDGLPDYVEAPDVLAGIAPAALDHATAIQFADWDNDGDQDLFLGRRGPNVLLRNELVPTGTLAYVDVTAGSGLGVEAQRTTGGGWGDYDGDGDLDLYVVNHAWCFPSADQALDGSADHLYRNDGDGVFTDVTDALSDAVGEVSTRYGFTALWFDADRDGRQDLWVVNDHVVGGGRSVLWRNNGPDGGGGWRFTNVTETSGIAPVPDPFGKGTNAMGGAIGDVNRDGLPDVAYSNIGPNFLVESEAPWLWRDATDDVHARRALVPWGDTSVTWGTHLFDVDNDGDLDLAFAAGPIRGTEAQVDALFENLGPGKAFADRSAESGAAAPGHGAASAQVDLDGDGWLDWVVADWRAGLEVWHNRGAAVDPDRVGRHWLIVDLAGDGVRVNRDAFGAIVAVTRLDGGVDTCFRNPMPSMSSTGDPGCHFGLGPDDAIAGLRIEWPDGQVDELDVDDLPAVDQRFRIARVP